MKRRGQSIQISESIMADSATDDLEPLFDYRRVQPRDFVSIDDDDSDTSPDPSPKRKKVPDAAVKKVDEEVEVIKVVDHEEDWLPPPPPPPPKVSAGVQNKHGEDSTIKELRRKKEELVSLVSFAQSAKDLFQEVEKRPEAETEQLSNPHCERAKIVISIQDKDGIKQFRIYVDDKFERLFKMYADKVKLDVQSLVFSFDGDKIGPAATPNDLGMEDNDIIEVHLKKI
ncbi:hypothetical protein SLEP1_g4267 [Rubroshorea leprosula]|uniref:Rad60/SUMO-like domain-containing protein n=1 Tax=Rubroshorea leprosula TaxID=152421 RepID=A0AAV5HNN2_9ROSI|nr:hypothetical protein SLEP1_g4267 [Rubroshorea leprosula]